MNSTRRTIGSIKDNKINTFSISTLIEKREYIKYEKILEYNDNEINSLEYKKALINDQRTYFQYYLSLLKVGHLLIFSFYFNNKDYNSQVIKMFLFFFFFAVHLNTNALFFSDNTMHKIYKDEGRI